MQIVANVPSGFILTPTREIGKMEYMKMAIIILHKCSQGFKKEMDAARR
jgi:hypothetical protein